MPKPISTDNSDFPKLREKGCLYVDKTAYFHKLLTGADDCFFLARPRRFGKSLMISTFKAIFEGRKELFGDLAIAKTDWRWEKYPVMYFNLGFPAASTSAAEFAARFPGLVENAVRQAGGEYDAGKDCVENFGNAIDELSAQNGGRGVVILIDEYDDPVARLLDKRNDAEQVREMLAAFYGQMKDRTGAIRFLMITGVSKFTKMSVFSALSNLVDLSFKDDYATMLGYTEAELDEYFDAPMRAHAKLLGLEYGAYRQELKRWFNGYRFGKHSEETVYNPISIGNNLACPTPEFSPYWSTTGKSSMLMNYLKKEEVGDLDMENVQDVSMDDFDVTDLRDLRTVAMLYQTGYLTIRDFDPMLQTFTLRVPDEEVRRDLAALTAAIIANHTTNWVSALARKLLKAKWPEFFAGLRALYAGLPYGPKEGVVHEFSYERVLMTLLKSQGVQCRAEDRQANGQADVVAEHPCGIYVFELKVGESAEAALDQVRKKGYDAPYRADGRPVWLVGLSFDRETRQLADAKAERLTSNNHSCEAER